MNMLELGEGVPPHLLERLAPLEGLGKAVRNVPRGLREAAQSVAARNFSPR